MSIFKVPSGVLKSMEAIRNHFFNGNDPSDKKIIWAAWDKVLASKSKGGLGVSSFHALNRALLLKWVWRFISRDGSLWFRVISALYGASLDTHQLHLSSNWSSILRELHLLKAKGMDFLSYCRIRVGNGMDTRFWLDNWIGDKPLYVMFPRLFALDLNKEISVAGKLHSPLHLSFRRSVRSGFEQQLMENLQSMIDSVSLSTSHDRWICNLSGDGDFRIKEVRNVIDDMFLPSYPEPTRWVNIVPIKINIFSWRARRNCLPSRANLLRRGVNIDSSMCPICMLYVEDVNHILLRCDFAQSVMRRICKWWDVEWQPWVSFQDWISWLVSNRLSSNLLKMLEGVFWVAWWSIWMFRNHTIFDVNPPRRSMIFDNIVSYSFNWCHSRCNRKFSWDDWLKNPHLITL